MANITQFTISFPDWFYGILSLGIITFIFYLGFYWDKLNKICKEFPRMYSALIRISDALFSKDITKDNIFIGESPAHLTDYGLKIVEESGIPEFYDFNKKRLLKLIKSHRPQTPADVDEAVKIIMFENGEDLPKFSLLKTYSYQKPLPIIALLLVCAIYIRDKIFEEPSIRTLIVKEQ